MTKHWSDCAVNSEPSYPAGECDCGGFKQYQDEGMCQACEFGQCTAKAGCVAISNPPPKQEQGEPQPTLYVKDIDGNFHLHKEKGHTENCAALGDDCCPENHLPPSRVGVGDDYSISEPAGYIDHADGQVVWKSTKPANGSLLYTTPQQRKPLTDEWIPVTQTLLNEQHDWLYKPMWIAMPNGHVCTGYYEWQQGRCPDRFITDDLGDIHAYSASHVMPMLKPTAPTIEVAHNIKAQA